MLPDASEDESSKWTPNGSSCGFDFDLLLLPSSPSPVLNGRMESWDAREERSRNEDKFKEEF